MTRSRSTTAACLLILLASGVIVNLPGATEDAAASHLLTIGDIAFTEKGPAIGSNSKFNTDFADDDPSVLANCRDSASSNNFAYTTSDLWDTGSFNSIDGNNRDVGCSLVKTGTGKYVYVNGGGNSGQTIVSFSSTDGTTWSSSSTVADSTRTNAGLVAVDNTSSETVFMALGLISGDAKLKRSTNAGTTWGTEKTITGCGSVGMYPVNDTTIYVSCRPDQDTGLFFKRSTDIGNTWTTISTIDGFVETVKSQLFREDENTFQVIRSDTPGADLFFDRSTDGGQTWSNGTIFDHSGGFQFDFIHLGGSMYAGIDQIGSDGSATIRTHFSDDGTSWSTATMSTTSSRLSTNQFSVSYDCASKTLVYAWHDATETNRNRFAVGSHASLPECEAGAAGCTGTETCSALLSPQTTFRDIRTTYTQQPFVYVREDGGSFDTPDSVGRLNKLDEDLGTLLSVHPCTAGNPGTAPWEYSPPGHFGLSVTADERVIVSCLKFLETTPQSKIQSITKTLDNSSSLQTSLLTLGWTTGNTDTDNPGWTIRRIDSAYAQTIGATLYQEDALTLDSETVAPKACDTTGTIVGIGVDPTTNRSATVSDQGLKIWPATPTTLCQTVISSGSVTGTKVALYGSNVWVGRSMDVRYYLWDSVDGFTLQATNATLGLSSDHEADIRPSKDGDFLVVWTGSDVTVVHSGNLSQVVAPQTLTGGTINGCDMDLLNNFLYCVTDSTIPRVAVHSFVPTFFGVDKNGTYSAPGTTGLGDPFGGETPLFTPPSGSGVVIGDDFLGTDTSGTVAFFGETGAAYFLGILLIAGVAAAFYGAVRSGIGVAAGAFVGLVLAVALQLIALFWAVLLAILAIGTTVVVVMRGS